MERGGSSQRELLCDFCWLPTTSAESALSARTWFWRFCSFLIRAAGEQSRFHSTKLRNVSARKVEVIISSSVAQTHVLLHCAQTEMSSFPVNVYIHFHLGFTFVFSLYIFGCEIIH